MNEVEELRDKILEFPRTDKYEEVIRKKAVSFFNDKLNALAEERESSPDDCLESITKDMRNLRRMRNLIKRLPKRHELSSKKQRAYLFELADARKGNRVVRYVQKIIEYYEIRLRYDDYSPSEALRHLADKQELGWGEEEIRASILHTRKTQK